MKKSIPILLAVLLCLCTQTFAQNRADELMKQAQENLAKKEYIKARYLFLQAYNAFATQENYAQAVKCGVNASALYHRENYYKEASTDRIKLNVKKVEEATAPDEPYVYPY